MGRRTFEVKEIGQFIQILGFSPHLCDSCLGCDRQKEEKALSKDHFDKHRQGTEDLRYKCNMYRLDRKKKRAAPPYLRR